ncbi:MAG: hypothetical protein ACHP9Y_02360, partial [Gammaproteobacteria bacterium]
SIDEVTKDISLVEARIIKFKQGNGFGEDMNKLNYLEAAKRLYKILLKKYQLALKIYEHFTKLADVVQGSDSSMENFGLAAEANKLWELFIAEMNETPKQISMKNGIKHGVETLLTGGGSSRVPRNIGNLNFLNGGNVGAFTLVLARPLTQNIGNLQGLESCFKSMLNARSTPIDSRRASIISTASASSPIIMRPKSAFMAKVAANLNAFSGAFSSNDSAESVYGEQFKHLYVETSEQTLLKAQAGPSTPYLKPSKVPSISKARSQNHFFQQLEQQLQGQADGHPISHEKSSSAAGTSKSEQVGAQTSRVRSNTLWGGKAPIIPKPPEQGGALAFRGRSTVQEDKAPAVPKPEQEEVPAFRGRSNTLREDKAPAVPKLESGGVPKFRGRSYTLQSGEAPTVSKSGDTQVQSTSPT